MYNFDDKSLYYINRLPGGQKRRAYSDSKSGHARESVQSPLVVLLKVRKGGDFFYGKSADYENHT